MNLTAKERQQIEVFSKEAAMKHYKKHNAGASDQAAWQFALRTWRTQFLHVGCEIIALWRAHDEMVAATPNN